MESFLPRKLDQILVIDVEATCWQGEPLEGTHHPAGDDAWKIAAILAAVLRRARTPA
jgi:inhibitor of KinA sporulation pathway (predicted exonuclease)